MFFKLSLSPARELRAADRVQKKYFLKPHLSVCPEARERRLPAAKAMRSLPRLHKLETGREDSPPHTLARLHLPNLVIDSLQG